MLIIVIANYVVENVLKFIKKVTVVFAVMMMKRNAEAATRRGLSKRCSQKLRNIHGKTPAPESLF